MKNKLYTLIGATVATAAVVIAGTVSYQIGKGSASDAVSELRDSLQELESRQQDANIVKRVSEQMEVIAYQQVDISEKERNKAVLAMNEAERQRLSAEHEKQVALEAENNAKRSASEAVEERKKADVARRNAEEKEAEATRLKLISDTLRYRAVARTLGNSSIQQLDAESREITDIMAYASWFFLDKYKGNTYLSESFKALAYATNNTATFSMSRHGAVNAIAVVPNVDHEAIVVSNYGEIHLFKAKADIHRSISQEELFFDKNYFFRDVVILGSYAYALDVNGTLVRLNYRSSSASADIISLEYNSKKRQHEQKGKSSYFKMLKLDSKTILIAERSKLCWYSTTFNKLSDLQNMKTVQLDKRLSTLLRRGDVVSLFYEDGSYEEMDAAGKRTQKQPLTSDYKEKNAVVTSATYNEKSHCTTLGLKSGCSLYLNRYDRLMEALPAHKSKSSGLANIGDDATILVTGAYDGSIYIWKLDELYYSSGLTYQQELKAQRGVKYTPDDKMSKDWFVPISYSFDGWVQAIAADNDLNSLWIGTSQGKVYNMCVSVEVMSKRLGDNIKRNFTHEEWNRYVGNESTIPYVKLK